MPSWAGVLAILREPDTLAAILLSVRTACVVMPLLAVCGVALGYVLLAAGRVAGFHVLIFW